MKIMLFFQVGFSQIRSDQSAMVNMKHNIFIGIELKRTQNVYGHYRCIH